MSCGRRKAGDSSHHRLCRACRITEEELGLRGAQLSLPRDLDHHRPVQVGIPRPADGPKAPGADLLDQLKVPDGLGFSGLVRCLGRQTADRRGAGLDRLTLQLRSSRSRLKFAHLLVLYGISLGESTSRLGRLTSRRGRLRRKSGRQIALTQGWRPTFRQLVELVLLGAVPLVSRQHRRTLAEELFVTPDLRRTTSAASGGLLRR